jgi:hypothetical protein
MHTVGVFTLACLIPLNTIPYTFTPTLIFQQLSIHILIPLPSHLRLYNITDVLLFSFFSLFPQIPLLQKCSTTEFVYDLFVLYTY